MKKIPTIFVRDLSKQPSLVTPVWVSGCEWVRDGEGIATRKYDGTSCLVRDGRLYKRRELSKEQYEDNLIPLGFELVDQDANTTKVVGWVPIGDGPEDRWHREAYTMGAFTDGTYELLGPKIQGNKEGRSQHVLQSHQETVQILDAPRTFARLREWLPNWLIEGIVWHHPDGRMAKIKRRDFGIKW